MEHYLVVVAVAVQRPLSIIMQRQSRVVEMSELHTTVSGFLQKMVGKCPESYSLFEGQR